MSVRACGLSDVGQSRSHNEDCFAIDAEHGLFLVADGMGGHGHGEVASQLAVEAIRHAMLQDDAQTGGANSPSAEGIQPHAARLAAAFRVAHNSVVHAMREDSTLLGMGTTAVGCAIHGDIAAFAHVGDSRAYRLRDDELELVTEDHTWVNEQVMAGYLSADQARSHPLKSVVTRAIGGDREITVDLREIEVRDGDLFLLCSDGLNAMLNDEDIHDYLAADGSLEEICHRLVDAANDRGGLDNITVLVLVIGS
ncbi:MAG: Stp1/IreP family PP2C-type Ser/Thr phosphatase [Acidimicrobiia bacterium]